MKCYRIKIQANFPESGRINSSANGRNVPNHEDFFDRIRAGELLSHPPVFDYFVLESYDEKKYWEWSLFDVFSGIGDFPHNGNWYVSNKLKELLQLFRIAPDYRFYETKLLFHENKMTYWIFQFVATYRRLNKMKYIDFEKSSFLLNDTVQSFSSYEAWSEFNEQAFDEYGKDMILDRICLKEKFDFVPLNPLNSDVICSSELKLRIEESGITGFEFSELDYEVVVG
ncbi:MULTISPECIES: hypothetical protein [Sphingobacterium]|uniref:hypothetical protein n=1 Tax=Sphingobacterium TaxID=28453 RepID=UPI0013DAFAF5|nr:MULTISPECIES: hypothetical protein [unclassified Sphingobacterium]